MRLNENTKNVRGWEASKQEGIKKKKQRQKGPEALVCKDRMIIKTIQVKETSAE